MVRQFSKEQQQQQNQPGIISALHYFINVSILQVEAFRQSYRLTNLL